MRFLIAVLGVIIQIAPAAAEDAASRFMQSGTCLVCHGDSGASLGPAIPSIGGMDRDYLIAAMLAYKYPGEHEFSSMELGTSANADAGSPDWEGYPRYSSVMGRIAPGYSFNDITAVAYFFANEPISRANQKYDKELARQGETIHTEYCESCHLDGGTSSGGGVPFLSGQWMDYLRFTIDDYLNGRREMPVEMALSIEQVYVKYGNPGLDKLVNFYARSQTKSDSIPDPN